MNQSNQQQRNQPSSPNFEHIPPNPWLIKKIQQTNQQITVVNKKHNKQHREDQNKISQVAEYNYQPTQVPSNQNRDFFQQSISMLKIYDPQFQFLYINNKDLLQNIVNLYGTFFQKHNSYIRSQQIKSIYKKSICQKTMIIPTILIWFADWVNKIFKNQIKLFLNTSLQKNYTTQPKTSKNIKQFYPSRKIDTHRQLSKNTIFNKQHHYIQPSSMRIQTTQPITQNYYSINQLPIDRKFSKPQMRNNSPKSKPNTGNYLVLQKDNKQTLKQKIYLNRQIFISAYYDEITNYYKFHEDILPQLDEAYLRTFRRNDRRSQITKYLDILASSFAKNQPLSIKKTISNYFNLYPKIGNKQIDNRRSHSVHSEMPISQTQKYKIKQNINQNSQWIEKISIPISDQKPSQIKKSNRQKATRIQIQKKRIQIQLPQVNNYDKIKQNSKILLLNNKQSIINNYYQRDIITKISLQKYKQYKQYKKTNNILSFLFYRKKIFHDDKKNHFLNLKSNHQMLSSYQHDIFRQGIFGMQPPSK